MFFNVQEKNFKDDYQNLLITIGALSNLFSESTIPYLDYRVVENVFCKSFGAKNLARFDCSADAQKDDIGIGIKTFLHNSKNQKVAEFNEFSTEIRSKTVEEQVQLVSKLRNDRINFTKRNYNINQMIYHLITRDKSKFYVIETPMDTINLEKLKILDSSKTSVKFKDDKNEYSFNYSKSTLFKKFDLENILLEIPISIIDDPYTFLKNELLNKIQELKKVDSMAESVILPLYSEKNGEKVVFEKSGLNQWNAGGRARNINEVYIPIKAIFHKEHPDFFPDRETPFDVVLPNGKILNMKICQDNGKALMSNPNKALGEWILREVLSLKEGEILTYQKLKELGIDSLLITKGEKYSINFIKNNK